MVGLLHCSDGRCGRHRGRGGELADQQVVIAAFTRVEVVTGAYIMPAPPCKRGQRATIIGNEVTRFSPKAPLHWLFHLSGLLSGIIVTVCSLVHDHWSLELQFL